ncbi:hypothetical protein K2173_026388 [Erythroxylum novogranatense]|uniref:Microbial collagenase n=1 Tax=Erythroxylum novogranatense TaxID=1862640 RepID=A0AAV8SN18_9ROSI|nr:hypothetical protein K2173_026388 [Erythroxylum novogranatense]
MGSQAAVSSSYSCSSVWVALNSWQLSSPKALLLCLKADVRTERVALIPSNQRILRLRRAITRASLDEKDQSPSIPLLIQEEGQDELPERPQPNKDVEESVKVLKNAAKTRKIAKEEVLSALSVIEKAKIDPSTFLGTLGGSESPGRTWMLIFTAEKQLKSGRYFPLTAVQRFDAAARRIENGVFLGPIGSLTFEGRFSWKKRILAFIFESIGIKVGPFSPVDINIGKKGDREPSTEDPFFIWFYVDEEIAVARGRSGGTAFWCRCHRVTQ